MINANLIYLFVFTFYFLLTFFDFIEKDIWNLLIFVIPAIFYDVYCRIKKWQSEDNEDKQPPEPTVIPVNPPDKPNPPDLASAQFNEFMKRSREKEKVPRK